MTPTGLGDGARLASMMRHNADIRLRLGQLTQELSTGTVADPAAHLGGDTAGLADVDRRLALAQGYGGAAREAAARLATMQVAVGRADDLRAGFLGQLMAPAPSADPTGRAAAGAAGSAAFDDLVAALNGRLAGGSLFAGTATEGPALAGADAMMASIRAAAAGDATAADVQATLDAWFDDPAGGFATMGYLGTPLSATRPTDAGETVTLGARADDPAFRGILKAAAMGVLAADPALALPAGEAAALVVRARDGLLSLAVPLASLGAGLGLAESRTEAAEARHAARASAFGIMRAEMTRADPYDTASALEAVRTQLETHYALTGRLASLSLAGFLR